MSGPSRWIAFTGALLALTGVMLSAIGSHAIEPGSAQGAWGSATGMHLFNAAGLLGLAALNSRHRSRTLAWGAWVIVLGTLLFAGSIYVDVISGLKVTNMAPVGGVLMMSGWLLAALGLVWKP